MDFSFWQFGTTKKKDREMASNTGQLNRAPTITSMEDVDSEIGSGDYPYASYMVQIPATPDNQPIIDAQKSGEQIVSTSLFTGGHNRVTRALSKEKVIESEMSHTQMGGSKGSSICSIPGCNGSVMTDSHGADVFPCECEFKICRECYREALRSDNPICPGCKEVYVDKAGVYDNGEDSRQSFHVEKRLSLMKPNSPGSEFDYTHYLTEANNKSYGYGNALWPKDDSVDGEENGDQPKVFAEKQWKPLTRKLKISAGILSPYRFDTNSLNFILMLIFLFFSY